MKVTYVYDALCGWCYGFSPVMEQFYQDHRSDVSFEVVSGGMITGSRIGPIGEVASYIKWAYKEVEQATGVTFGEGFLKGVLEEGTTVFTSVPLGIAMSVFKQHRPDEAVLFAGALQKAVYYDGLAPQDTAAYAPLAEAFGLDGKAFVEQMRQPESQVLAEADFRRSQQLGVSGFPTVFAEVGGDYYRLASGFTRLADLESRFATFIQNKN
jgi:putative protein-disulfide isomerase